MITEIYGKLFIKFYCILISWALLHCSTLPEKTEYSECNSIPTAEGPEDIAQGSLGGKPVIYISAHERRQWIHPGNIYVMDVQSKEVRPLKRSNEPNDLFFAPHGIDLYKKGGKELLYVITHGKERDGADHRVLIYETSLTELKFIKQIQSPLIISPNDLAIDANGNFFIANDSKKRGSFWEVFWGLKRSSIVYCDIQKETDCKIVAKDMAFANSIAIMNNDVYISVTREGKVYRFKKQNDNMLTEKTFIAEAQNADNLFWHGNDLLVGAHTSDYKFLRHSKGAHVKSPGIIWRINVQSGQKNAVYANDGTQISAPSGGFIMGETLYISQVFNANLLECRKK